MCCFLAQAHAQPAPSTFTTDSLPAHSSVSKILPLADLDDQLLPQQIRFYKIARQVLAAASPACKERTSSNIAPGWVIDRERSVEKASLELQPADCNRAPKTEVDIAPGRTGAALVGARETQVIAFALEAHVKRLIIGIAKDDIGRAARVNMKAKRG